MCRKYWSLILLFFLVLVASCERFKGEAAIAEDVYQSKTEEEAFDRIRKFAVGTWSSTESGDIWWRLDVPPGGRSMTVYMSTPTSNDWGEGISDELQPFQDKWSDTGKLMFGFKTRNGALRFIIGPDGRLVYWDNDEKRFYGLDKGDSSRFTPPLPSMEAKEQQQQQVAADKCVLIEQGEAEARQQCDSGRLQACREIAGWVANKVMEGCASSARAPENAFQQDISSSEAEPVGEKPPVVQVAHEPAIDVSSKEMNPPRYPPTAFRAGIQGEVILIIDVDAEGRVANVAVGNSSGNRDLDRAAMEAARKWKFSAAKSVQGTPMAGRIRVPVTFALGGDDSSKGAAQQGESASSVGFKSIRDAIAELWAHPDYANLREADFSRIDVAKGVAEADANTRFFLPSGSADTLVIYTENNVGTPFLTVQRFDGRQWVDVSVTALPGYTNKNGTNYYLDSTGGAVRVRSLPEKRAWRYNNGRFAVES